MKKSFLILVALTIVGVSCKAPKAAREKRTVIDGTWILEDVSYENAIGNFKSTLFNDAEISASKEVNGSSETIIVLENTQLYPPHYVMGEIGTFAGLLWTTLKTIQVSYSSR